jgi:hypothetical protein
MLARENPHCGVSGVPFMNSTTGEEATARSMALRTSSERQRIWNGVRKRVLGAAARTGVARVTARKAWCSRQNSAFGHTGSCITVRTWGIARLENMVSCVGCEVIDDGTEALRRSCYNFVMINRS